MADDRLYIKCACGKMIMIARIVAGRIGLREKNLQKFLDEHKYCESYEVDGKYIGEFAHFNLINEGLMDV